MRWFPFKSYEQYIHWLNNIRSLSLILFFGLCLYSCNSLKNYPQDNFVEEIVEDVIEEKTGLDIDLSPFTPEEKKGFPENLYQSMIEGKI